MAAVTDARFSSSGELLLTSSFDGTLKIWNTRDMQLLKTYSGHNGKVMGCEFSPDERMLVSVGFDRTLKKWEHKDLF